MLGYRGYLRRSRSDRGANLVEFALLMPLLVLLVLGIVEFGWKFGQFNDVRHGVREGARYAAVNAGTESEIKDHVCAALDALSAGMTATRIYLTDGTPSGVQGETATIKVEADVNSLTNVPFVTIFLPSMLTSEVSFRLEQDSTNWGTLDDGSLSC